MAGHFDLCRWDKTHIQRTVIGESGGEKHLWRLFRGTESGAVVSAGWQVMHQYWLYCTEKKWYCWTILCVDPSYPPPLKGTV